MKKIMLGKKGQEQEFGKFEEYKAETLREDVAQNVFAEECDTPLLIENYAEINEEMKESKSIEISKEELKLGSASKEEARIVGEERQEREENVKHFRLSDGTCKAVYFNEPIHYYDEKEQCYKEIDNTLYLAEKDESDEEDFCGYENHNGRTKVKFARNAEEKNLMRVQKGEHKLIWGFLGKGQKSTENLVSDFAGKLSVEAKLCKTEIKSRAKLDGIDRDKRFAFANKLSDKIKYENIASGTDLEYTVTGGKVKEDIVVKERAGSYEYAFLLRAENLDMELSSNQMSVEFFVTKLNDDGSSEREVIFTMPSAYMRDAKGEHSDNVVYDIEELGVGKYILKVKPTTALNVS